MSVAARSGRAPVPAELVRDLGAVLCRRLWRGDGEELARAGDLGADRALRRRAPP